MADDDRKKTPPGGIARRVQTQTERDVSGYRAKLERDREAIRSLSTEEWEDPTGNYSGEELAKIRARRPTDERIGRLEKKHDKLSESVGEVKVTVSEIKGQMSVWPTLVEELREQVDRSLQRDDVTFTAKVDVHKAQAQADVEVSRTAKLAEIEDTKADRQARRELVKAIATKAIAAAGILWAFVSVTYLSKCGG